MKLLSLIKAAFSQDMSLFNYSTKKNSSKISKIILPVFLFICCGFSIGSYAFPMADILSKVDLTYVVLSLFILIVTILTFIEGIYKSQGILFEARDNDLLSSLPIKKSYILFIRILKILTFQYLFNLMFLLPAFIAYIYYEKPGAYFYIISIFISLLIPIIPTVLSSTIGYIVKLVSTKFKSKKIMQTLFSFVVFIGVFYLTSNINGFMDSLQENALGINDVITKIYYPLGLFISIIKKFDIITVIKLLLINIIPLLIFIFIGSKFYFKIISSSSEHGTSKRKKIKEKEIKVRRPIIALTRKEIKRYFSSPVYMYNTGIGLILSVIGTVALCVKGAEYINTILVENEFDLIGISLPVIFYAFILILGGMTSISSSSISLEGKTINITKSLPITEATILKSKILACFVIELPFLLLSDIIFIFVFKINILFSLLILGISLVIIFLNACAGLLANLKYPKMDASNDTEVVKQSMSSFVSVFAGMVVSMGSILAIFALCTANISNEIILLLNLAILLFISLILYLKVMKKGVKRYRDINV